MARLAQNGIFVRGAVVCGPHYDDGLVRFSPAFVRTYDVEQREAFYPRAIVEDVVVRRHRALSQARRQVLPHEHGSHARDDNRIWRDTDGRWFLNYLVHEHGVGSSRVGVPGAPLRRAAGGELLPACTAAPLRAWGGPVSGCAVVAVQPGGGR